MAVTAVGSATGTQPQGANSANSKS